MVPCMQVSNSLSTRQQEGLSRTTRANKQLKGGVRAAFFLGGNSTCRTHIRKHYEIYKARCQDGNIPENHRALRRDLYEQMKMDKRAKGGAQLTLDAALVKPSDAKLYTRDGATHAVAQFVACDDQVCVMVVQRRRDGDTEID